MRDKIKLVSTVQVRVIFTPRPKTNVPCQTKWKSKNLNPVVRQHVVFKEAKIK